MNWSPFIIAFCVAVITGAVSQSLFTRVRPQWSEGKRLLAAALLLPALTVGAALIGILAILASGPGKGENMQGLAVAAVATIGGAFALLAFLGGMIGAALRQHGRRR